MYCLDSDLLIAFLKGDDDAVRFVYENSAVCTTSINVQEILVGVREERLELVYSFFHDLTVVAYDGLCVQDVVSIKKSLLSKGQPIGSFDEIIAGICVAKKLTLVTRNIQHFTRIPNLRVLSW